MRESAVVHCSQQYVTESVQNCRGSLWIGRCFEVLRFNTPSYKRFSIRVTSHLSEDSIRRILIEEWEAPFERWLCCATPITTDWEADRKVSEGQTIRGHLGCSGSKLCRSQEEARLSAPSPLLHVKVIPSANDSVPLLVPGYVSLEGYLCSWNSQNAFFFSSIQIKLFFIL